MTRVMLTWELGMDLGHLVPLRALSIELLSRGHEVFLASRDLSSIREVFGNCAVTVLPAPVNNSRGSQAAIVTYAELLCSVGFSDPVLWPRTSTRGAICSRSSTRTW